MKKTFLILAVAVVLSSVAFADEGGSYNTENAEIDVVELYSVEDIVINELLRSDDPENHAVAWEYLKYRAEEYGLPPTEENLSRLAQAVLDQFKHSETETQTEANGTEAEQKCELPEHQIPSAPELKNIMPNSYQKLTRLSEREEKSFFERTEVRTAVLNIDDDFFQKKKLEDKHYQVFTETNCGIQFYRLLISVSPLEDIYNAEYKNKILTKDECLKMQGDENCIWQIVFLKDKKNALQKILTRSYGNYWASQGEWEGYHFNDLMIKPLNENEIGFFITEVTVAFTVDRERFDKNIVPVTYRTCKNQIAASNTTWFSKYKIKENILSAWSKDGIDIQASDCLIDSKCPLKYSIQNAFDGTPATSYVENTEDDLMIIEIGFSGKFEKLAIINGYALNSSLYKANNRVKCLSGDIEFTDNNLNYQIIKCLGNYLPFDGIYRGEKFNDTCIAELNSFVNKFWLFGEINE